MTLRLLCVLVLSGAGATASAQEYAGSYRDSYPRNPGIDVVGYVFQLTVSDESDSIVGMATTSARYVEPGQRELRLDLIRASEELDGAGMVVSRVESVGQTLEYRHLDDRLVIDLGRDIEVGALVEVTVHYSGVPAAGLVIGPNKYGDRTFFSDNWSSRVRNWLPVVDHPSDKATTEMIVVAPAHYQVASNGTRVEETDLGDGTRRTHYSNPVPTATWLYFVGIAQFAVQRVDTFGDVPIETWVYWQDRDAGFYDFAEPSKQVLAFFSDLVGPYVNDRLANVVSNATPGGGMEAASTPAYSDRSVSGTRDRRWQHVIIHEIAHQWFGNAVTELHWNDVWLSEGFATYYTLLFREHLYGYDDFIEGLRNSRTTVRDFYETDFDFQVVRDYVEDLNDVSGPMMYHKGAWVLHMLRARLGAEAFDAGIHSYYAEFVNRNARSADLQRHLEEASGEDLGTFFAQWLFQGGIPELRVTWSNQDGQIVYAIEQIQERYFFDLEVEIAFVYADGTTSAILPVSLGVSEGEPTTARGRWSADGEVVGILVDPRTRLLARWQVDRR